MFHLLQEMLHLEVTKGLGRTYVTLMHTHMIYVCVCVCVCICNSVYTHTGLMFTNQSLSVIMYVTGSIGSRTQQQ